MQDNSFEHSISKISQRFSELSDMRTGNNKFIKMCDIGLSAFCRIFHTVLLFFKKSANDEQQ